MEADEMMDDDLFADLYGDEEPKRTGSTTNPASLSNNTAAVSTTSVTPAASSVITSKGSEITVDPYPAPSAPPSAPAQAQRAQRSNELNGHGTGDDNNPIWEAQQGKNDANNGGNSDYQGYNSYEQETDGYGDYSGAGNGNMVDVGGSTAIKEDGKMFIGGLNWETTDESLKNYFSQFGEVTECTVMRDGTTGRSRGFGFLTFKDPKTVNIVMVKEHYLDGKIIDPKRAIPRDEQEKTSKIFVGGVSQEATETDFREYFTQFGRVLDATLMIDKDTGRPRGFGFVTFDSESAVENALNHPNLEIMSKAIEVKKAQPRGNPRNAAGGHFDDRDDRGGFNRTDRRGFDRDASASGSVGGAGYGQQSTTGSGAAGQSGQNLYNGMTPAMMAQYWQRVQQYMAAVMQQQLAAGRGRGMSSTSNPMMNSMMNPAMMQQMQQMQQMQMAQQGAQGQIGSNTNPMGGMAPGMGVMSSMGTQGMGMMGPQGPQQQSQQQALQGPYGNQLGGPPYGLAGGYGHQQQHDGGYDNTQQQQQHGGHGAVGAMGHTGVMDPRFQRQAKDYQSHHQRDFNPQQPSSWEANQQQQNRMPPSGPSSFNSPGTSNQSPQPNSGPPPNAPTGPRNARNPVGPAFRGPGVRGGAGPGIQGGAGVGPMRGPGGFSRGAAVGGIQQGPVGGHGFHPYARNTGNQSGAADRGGY